MADAKPESLAAKRRRMAEERAVELAERARAARPGGVNAMGHDAAAQRTMGLEVLLAARALVCREARGLREAVQTAGEEGIRAHYADRLLWALLREPLATWEVRSRPSQEEALRVVDATLTLAGVTPPTERPPKPRRRPGPKVHTTPPTPEEVERRKALHAASRSKPSNT